MCSIDTSSRWPSPNYFQLLRKHNLILMLFDGICHVGSCSAVTWWHMVEDLPKNTYTNSNPPRFRSNSKLRIQNPHYFLFFLPSGLVLSLTIPPQTAIKSYLAQPLFPIALPSFPFCHLPHHYDLTTQPPPAPALPPPPRGPFPKKAKVRNAEIRRCKV